MKDRMSVKYSRAVESAACQNGVTDRRRSPLEQLVSERSIYRQEVSVTKTNHHVIAANALHQAVDFMFAFDK
jgi:hypothetical protein